MMQYFNTGIFLVQALIEQKCKRKLFSPATRFRRSAAGHTSALPAQATYRLFKNTTSFGNRLHFAHQTKHPVLAALVVGNFEALNKLRLEPPADICRTGIQGKPASVSIFS